jgi:hypothetical protein
MVVRYSAQGTTPSAKGKFVSIEAYQELERVFQVVEGAALACFGQVETGETHVVSRQKSRVRNRGSLWIRVVAAAGRHVGVTGESCLISATFLTPRVLVRVPTWSRLPVGISPALGVSLA